MSTSRRSSACLALREAAMVEITPLTTGPASFVSVQIAATAMVPAPMKRTLWCQMQGHEIAERSAVKGIECGQIQTSADSSSALGSQSSSD